MKDECHKEESWVDVQPGGALTLNEDTEKSQYG